MARSASTGHLMIGCPTEFEGLLRPIETVYLARRNARRAHDVDLIARSLTEHGWHAPLVATASGEVLVGNGRLKAAKKLGEAQVPVLVVADDQREAIRRALVDNRASELSEWDSDVLRELAQACGPELFDGLGMGDVLRELAQVSVDEIDLSPSFGEPEQEDGTVFFEVAIPKDGLDEGRKTLREAVARIRGATVRVAR